MKTIQSRARQTLLVFVAVTMTSVGSCALAAQGEVSGQTLTSNAFPVGSITVDAKFKYIGKSEFVLYDVADCEIHLFAQIENNVVQRYYWIQFEGYLPHKWFSSYNYGDDPQRVILGGHAFHERSWFTNVDERRKSMKPGSDSAAVLKLFDAKGYRVGPSVVQLRMVRLDESKRKELMIIYSENLALHGLTAADFAVGGKAAETKVAHLEGLRQRAVSGLKMEMK